MQEFNVQFKSILNQLSLSHVAYKKNKKRKNTQNKTDQQLSPEMVMKIHEIRPKRRDYGGKDLWKR